MSAAPGTGTIPMPKDFATRAVGMTLAQIEEHFGCCDRVAARWRKEAGIAAPTKSKRPSAEELQRLTDTMSQEEAGRRCGVSGRTFAKWQRQAGIRAPQTRTFADRIAVAEARREAQAEQQPAWHAQADAARAYLQRLDPIWRCGPDGAFDHAGSHYRFRGRVYDADGIVTVAQAKGWQPDAWARLAVAA